MPLQVTMPLPTSNPPRPVAWTSTRSPALSARLPSRSRARRPTAPSRSTDRPSRTSARPPSAPVMCRRTSAPTRPTAASSTAVSRHAMPSSRSASLPTQGPAPSDAPDAVLLCSNATKRRDGQTPSYFRFFFQTLAELTYLTAADAVLYIRN